MRALLFDGRLRYESTAPEPEIAENDALLRIRCAGICNTDIEITRGYMGFEGILGHEFVAEVVDGPPELTGKRVVGEINVADGNCIFCRMGIPSQCSHRTTVGIDRHQGAFADYLSLPIVNLHLVPDNIPDESAVFVEPLAAALQITEALHISPRDRVLVIGAGKLGLLAAQVLRLTGAKLSVLVRRPEQEHLLQRWGIRSVYQYDNNSADVVVDCTGNEGGFALALDTVRPRGTIVLKSTYAKTPTADLTRIAVDEIRVVGSRCGPFDAALRLLDAKLIDVESMIDARYPIEQGIKAFEAASKPGALKVLLDF